MIRLRALAVMGQLLLLLVTGLLSQPAAAQAGAIGTEASPPPANHSLLFETINVAGTVRVNGIPVIRHATPGGSESSGDSLNPFLKQGTNRIDVQLDAPEGAASPSSRPVFHIAVRANDQKLLDLKQGAPDVTLPFSKTYTFEVKSFPALPLWKAAPPPPPEQSKKELTTALNTLNKQMRAALRKKDRKAVLAVFGPMMEGKQLLRGEPLGAIGIADVYETLEPLARKDVPPATVKAQNLGFEPLPDTNLYLVAGAEKRAAIGFRFPNGQDRGAYRVLMGKVNGKWQLLGYLSR